MKSRNLVLILLMPLIIACTSQPKHQPAKLIETPCKEATKVPANLLQKSDLRFPRRLEERFGETISQPQDLK